MNNIIEAMHDPRFFYETLKAGRPEWTWGSWEVFLKALFGLPITDAAGLELFSACTGLEAPPTAPARESYVLAGRRSGKSTTAALLACWIAGFTDWRKRLSPGETGWVFIAACDKEQAAVIRNYAMAFLESSPSLKKLIKNVTMEGVELRNGAGIKVKAASYRGLRGFTLICFLASELAYWRDSETGANPASEILRSVRPSLLASGGTLLGVSSVYSRSGVLWEQFRENYGRPGGPLIWKSESLKMNPCLSPSMIQAALEADWEAASGDWLSMFRADIQEFIGHELIDGAVIPGRYELPKIDGVSYHAYADPSLGRQDSFTLAVAHRSGEGRAVLDVLQERRPPFSPNDVLKEFSDVLKSYGIFKVFGDPAGGEFITEGFRKNGIVYAASERTTSENFLEFLPLLTTGAVELLDHKRLKSQLAGLERRTRSGGKDLVTHYPGGHDDCAVAAAGVCVLAGQGKETRKGKVYFSSKRIGPPLSTAAVIPTEKPPEPYVGPRRGRVYVPGKREPGFRDLTVDEKAEREKKHDEIVRQDMQRARSFPEHPEDE